MKTEPSWQTARELFTRANGSINIAHAAVDRIVDAGQGDVVAFKWLGKTGAEQHYSYRTLQDETSRFASALVEHGVDVGDSVYSLLGRVPELYLPHLAHSDEALSTHRFLQHSVRNRCAREWRLARPMCC